MINAAINASHLVRGALASPSRAFPIQPVHFGDLVIPESDFHKDYAAAAGPSLLPTLGDDFFDAAKLPVPDKVGHTLCTHFNPRSMAIPAPANSDTVAVPFQPAARRAAGNMRLAA